MLPVADQPGRDQRGTHLLLAHEPTFVAGDPEPCLPVHSDFAQASAGEHEGDSVLQRLLFDRVRLQTPPVRPA